MARRVATKLMAARHRPGQRPPAAVGIGGLAAATMGAVLARTLRSVADRSRGSGDAKPSTVGRPSGQWGVLAGHGPRLRRVNYRGRPVTLVGGVVFALAASVAAAAGAAGPGRGGVAAASLIAGLGAGTVGLYDDLAGGVEGDGVPPPKGLRGHADAVRHGRWTTGAAKVVGIGAAGLVAASLLPARRRGWLGRCAEVTLGAGVIAGTANLLNLLDLRPGRALKAGLLGGAPLTRVGPARAWTVGGSSAGGAASGKVVIGGGTIGRGAGGAAIGGRVIGGEPALMRAAGAGVAAGVLGAAVALLPADLDEQIMLGDCGANALGALLGVALAARTNLTGRAVALAAISALTAASERVSFTAVIETTPVLRQLDHLGRHHQGRPARSC